MAVTVVNSPPKASVCKSFSVCVGLCVSVLIHVSLCASVLVSLSAYLYVCIFHIFYTAAAYLVCLLQLKPWHLLILTSTYGCESKLCMERSAVFRTYGTKGLRNWSCSGPLERDEIQAIHIYIYIFIYIYILKNK